MNSNTHKIGRTGEEMAILYLREQSYEIIEKNWRFQNFEIDIVVKNGSTLIFVEVKSRTNSILSIVDIITSAQKKRIIKAAHHYIQINEIDLNIRFDLIFIDNSSKTPKLKHFKEFFTPYFD